MPWRDRWESGDRADRIAAGSHMAQWQWQGKAGEGQRRYYFLSHGSDKYGQAGVSLEEASSAWI